MGVIAVDYAADGDEDVYVANDSTPNLLYHNDGGRFTDVVPDVGLAYSGDGRTQAGMGLAADDYDGDGDTDLFVTNFSHDHNTLYANENGRFVDVSFAADLARESMPFLGWGVGSFDYDNDGDKDLLVANGHVYPQVEGAGLGTSYRQTNQLFANSGEGYFTDVSDQAGPGLAAPTGEPSVQRYGFLPGVCPPNSAPSGRERAICRRMTRGFTSGLGESGSSHSSKSDGQTGAARATGTCGQTSLLRSTNTVARVWVRRPRRPGSP
jgi:hypothetical protein